MNTATVTWTTYNNYGTLLQAYALQQEILALGYENEILGDEAILKEFRLRQKNLPKAQQRIPPEPVKRMTTLQRGARLLRSPAIIKRALLARTDRAKYERPYCASQAAFDRFRENELKIYDVSPDHLEELNERYDAFVAGSDQIWSVFDRDFHPYYYLDFATGKKIAYAPCMGTERIPEELKPKIRFLLSDYHALSAREDTSTKQLSELTGQSVEWVVDPTLLLDMDQWKARTENVEELAKKHYLLCYFLEGREWYFERAKYLAKKLHLHPILVPNRWDFVTSEYVIEEAIGPKEFVALFRDADFVLTDSYHGSIFSMVFEKQFLYLNRFLDSDPKSQNIRIHSLFGYLDLNERIIMQNADHHVLDWIDYSIVTPRIESARTKSIEYLRKSLA